MSMNAVKALLVSSLLSAVGSKPVLATEVLKPVATEDLDQFIGSTVFGQARAPLGVVSQADLTAGVIGVVGRHGEFTLMHISVLARNGVTLRAPTVSIGDFGHASTANLLRRGSTLIHPHMAVKEPPLG
jgi:hypothetical protein